VTTWDRDSAAPHTHVGLLGQTFSCTCCCPDPPPTPRENPGGSGSGDGRGWLEAVGTAVAVLGTLGWYRGDPEPPPVPERAELERAEPEDQR